VPEDHWQVVFPLALDDVVVAMANAIGDDFHADFSSLRIVKIDIFNFERRFEFVEYCSFHGTLLL
jgi:hypothetical protein